MAPWPRVRTLLPCIAIPTNTFHPVGTGLRPNMGWYFLLRWIRLQFAPQIYRNSRIPRWPWAIRAPLVQRLYLRRQRPRVLTLRKIGCVEASPLLLSGMRNRRLLPCRRAPPAPHLPMGCAPGMASGSARMMGSGNGKDANPRPLRFFFLLLYQRDWCSRRPLCI